MSDDEEGWNVDAIPLMVKASVSRNRSPVSFTTGLFLSMSVHIQKKRREERVDGEREEKNDESKGRATNRLRKKRVKLNKGGVMYQLAK